MYEYPPYKFPWLVMIGTVLFQISMNGLAAWWLLRKSHKPIFLDPVAWTLVGFGTVFIISLFSVPILNADMRHSKWPWATLLVGQIVIILGGTFLSVRRLRKVSTNSGMGAVIAALTFFLLLAYFLLPGMDHPREASYRTRCKTNLIQLGFVFHNYHDIHKSFPQQQFGESPSSWRIEILPYIDHEHEFNQYDQTAAWDSVQNAPIAQTVVRSLTCPSQYPRNSYPPGQPIQTAYAIPIYPQGIYPGRDPLSLKSISDGTSNTLMVVEACGQNIIWTEPRDVVVTKDSFGVNLPGKTSGSSPGLLSSHHFNGAQALLADGSVRFVSNETDPAILELLTNAKDSEVIGEW